MATKKLKGTGTNVVGTGGMPVALPLSSAKEVELRSFINSIKGPVKTRSGVEFTVAELADLVINNIAKYIKYGWYKTREVDSPQALVHEVWSRIDTTTRDALEAELKALRVAKRRTQKSEAANSNSPPAKPVQSPSPPPIAKATTAAPAQTKLADELAQLQQSASIVAANILSTNRAFYKHLSELYVWWRSANAVDGYLEAEYKKLGRKFKNKVAYGTNFAPLFWLVWGNYNGLTVDKVGRWSRALNKLHEKYESEKQYRTDSVEKLSNFMENSGGIDGLVTFGSVDDEDNIDDDVGAVGKHATFEPACSTEDMMAALYSKASKFYSSVQSPLLLSLNATIPLTDDGMGLVLVRKVGAQYQLIGGSGDEQFVRPIATQTYIHDFSALAPSVRTIVETISTQTLPKVIQAFYSNLEDDAAKGTAPAGKKSVRRLIYVHNSGELLLSPVRATSGVVTVVKPRQEVLEGATHDALLSTHSRRAIEYRLIADANFNLYAPSSDSIVPQCKPANFASHSLRLQHKYAPQDYLHVQFWPFLSTAAAPISQLIADSPKLGKGTWHGVLSLAWMRKFALEFVQKWVQSHGKHIKREHQKLFMVTFDKTELGVHFLYRDGVFESELAINFDGAATNKGVIGVCVLSKDFAVVMKAIADLGVVSDVIVDVDDDAIAIRFRTTAADYQVFVPTCTTDGVRSTKHFKQHNPVPLNVEAYEDYFDPADEPVADVEPRV